MGRKPVGKRPECGLGNLGVGEWEDVRGRVQSITDRIERVCLIRLYLSSLYDNAWPRWLTGALSGRGRKLFHQQCLPSEASSWEIFRDTVCSRLLHHHPRRPSAASTETRWSWPSRRPSTRKTSSNPSMAQNRPPRRRRRRSQKGPGAIRPSPPTSIPCSRWNCDCVG